MRFPTGLCALKHQDYRLFFAGQLISLVGTWMQRVAQSWLVLELTNSPSKLGLISALQSAPMLCLAFIAGVIADRLPKRRVLIGTQTALMIQAFILAAAIEGAIGHSMRGGSEPGAHDGDRDGNAVWRSSGPVSRDWAVGNTAAEGALPLDAERGLGQRKCRAQPFA